MFQELAACYSAYVHGDPCPLPPLPIQYQDYAAWQRQRLQGSFLEEQQAYWLRQLHEAPEILLPQDYPTPATRTHRAAYRTCPLPAESSTALRDFCRQQACTPFIAFLAAFAGVLHRYSGQEELLLGVPVARRSHAETEPLIGPFADTLLLRLNCAGDPTAREMLAHTGAVMQSASAYQELSFTQVAQVVHAAYPDSPPLTLRAVLNYRQFPMADHTMPGLLLDAAVIVMR